MGPRFASDTSPPLTGVWPRRPAESTRRIRGSLVEAAAFADAGGAGPAVTVRRASSAASRSRAPGQMYRAPLGRASQRSAGETRPVLALGRAGARERGTPRPRSGSRAAALRCAPPEIGRSRGATTEAPETEGKKWHKRRSHHAKHVKRRMRCDRFPARQPGRRAPNEVARDSLRSGRRHPAMRERERRPRRRNRRRPRSLRRD